MVTSRDLRGRIALDSYFLGIDVRHEENLDRAREETTQLPHKQLMRTPSQDLIPSEYSVDDSGYRTDDIVFYEYNLTQFDTAHFETAMPITIESNMLRCATPIIPTEFKFIQSSETQGAFSKKILFEREAHSRHGYLIPYLHIKSESYVSQTFRASFVAFPPWWRQFDVPKGCSPELLPCFTYIFLFIIEDLKSG